MTVTAATQKQIQYPWNPYNATAIKTWIDAVTAIVNGTLPAAFLSADTEGRAAMATGYFSEAKATDAFAAGAIVGTLLKAGALAASTQGRALMATGLFDEATATDKFASGAIAGTLLKAGALAATTQGRALFATGVLDEATVDAAVAAGAIDSDRLKSGSITATQLAADLTLSKRTVTVNDEDAGMTGASYAVNIGAALPANAIVLAHEINIVEQFVGEETTITLGGTTAGATAIVASTDLDAMTIGKYAGTAGARPQGGFSSDQLVATFAATALEDLTAGQAIITVWYSVLA
jgi:hypothetical protein